MNHCRRAIGAAVACAFALAALSVAPAGAADPPACPSSTPDAYRAELGVLTGPRGAHARIAVTAAPGCDAAGVLKKVQLKTYRLDGSLDDVVNLADVDPAAPIALGQVERGRLVEADVLVQTGSPPRTYVARTAAHARLLPDLAVSTFAPPPQTLTTEPRDISVGVRELNGDTAATADVLLLRAGTQVAAARVSVDAGGTALASFPQVAFPDAQPTELRAVIANVTPEETNAANDEAAAIVDVTEHRLDRLLFQSVLGGFGAQMNGHDYAGVLPAPPGSMPDLEAKVKALGPQFVRIFYSEQQEAIPERMDSFVSTVELAQQAGATINITYQTTARAKLNPALYMRVFADALDHLVHQHGITSLRWVTIQNEPNRTQLSPPEYENLYRVLDGYLRARGIRDQIRFMGGDLVEYGDLANLPYPDQDTWWTYMAEHMTDLLDAYSVHIYWSYWDIPRMEYRLKDVRRIVMDLPPAARKPVYVTEAAVRGILNMAGKPAVQPGYWADGTPMARTNIEAFQQLWFDVVAAQLGYAGVARWDAYWGKYDSSYNASYYLIGPPEEGWPLLPSYHALRLLLQTTGTGWHVLGLDPWADDDWRLNPDDTTNDQPEKELVAFENDTGQLTVVGLDTHGRGLNGTSPETPAYSIAGLPANTNLHLVIWNAAGDGQNASAGDVPTDDLGVARFSVPLHAGFALTTLPVQ